MQICIGVRSKQMQFIIGFCQTLKNRGVIFEVDFEGGFHFLRVLHIKMQNVANLPPVDWGVSFERKADEKTINFFKKPMYVTHWKQTILPKLKLSSRKFRDFNTSFKRKKAHIDFFFFY